MDERDATWYHARSQRHCGGSQPKLRGARRSRGSLAPGHFLCLSHVSGAMEVNRFRTDLVEGAGDKRTKSDGQRPAEHRYRLGWQLHYQHGALSYQRHFQWRRPGSRPTAARRGHATTWARPTATTWGASQSTRQTRAGCSADPIARRTHVLSRVTPARPGATWGAWQRHGSQSRLD